MTEFQKTFVWYELMTSDLAAAEAFYGAVVGWSARDAGMPGMRYSLMSAGDRQVAGMMTLPADAGNAPPHWLGYIAVPDVDAAAAALAQAGGVVHRAPDDIPGVGRFAMAADPQGGHFVLFQPMGMDAERPVSSSAVGHVGWHELNTTDWEAAFAFYSGQFGWTKGEGVDMGGMGIYQLFDVAGQSTGAMFNATHAPQPYWLFYFNVDDIDTAHARIGEAGGTVLFGPQEVPGGMWIVQAQDPQGAMFAVTGPRR
jgi:uncharacterized protein